jgi:hypothetical protein
MLSIPLFVMHAGLTMASFHYGHCMQRHEFRNSY